MSGENKKFGEGNIQKMKDLLEKGNIESALAGLFEKTKETLDFSSDRNRVGLNIVSYQSENPSITQDLCNIFDQYIHTS